MKIDYNKLVECQEQWKHTLPSDKAIEYTALSRELMHQAIDNRNQLPDKNVFISKDFSHQAIYYVFLAITSQKIAKIQTVGEAMCVTFEKE